MKQVLRQEGYFEDSMAIYESKFRYIDFRHLSFLIGNAILPKQKVGSSNLLSRSSFDSDW